MGKKSKDIKKEPRDGEIKKLKAHIRKLDKEISRLKSELKTYSRAFDKNIMFLKNQTKRFSVEELIEGAEVDLTLEEIGIEKENTFKAMEARWKCWKCDEGVLKMIIVPSSRYFRKCTLCENRTETKELTDDVDKGV